MEVQAIWNRKQTLTSILFLMNRYTMLLYVISYIYANIPETTHFTWRSVKLKLLEYIQALTLVEKTQLRFLGTVRRVLPDC